MRHTTQELLGWLVVIVLAMLFLSGCSLPTSLDSNTYRVAGLYRLDPPPPEYAKYMEEAKECLLPVVARRRFEDVSFWWTTKITWLEQPEDNPTITLGLYQNDLKRIIIVEWEVFKRRTPMHEMLHYLLPSAEHDTPAFAKCDPFQGAQYH